MDGPTKPLQTNLRFVNPSYDKRSNVAQNLPVRCISSFGNKKCRLGVYFTNILTASFAPKTTNLKCKKKSCARNFRTKRPRVKCWWNWSLMLLIFKRVSQMLSESTLIPGFFLFYFKSGVLNYVFISYSYIQYFDTHLIYKFFSWAAVPNFGLRAPKGVHEKTI
jgi:hypothetical protein